MIIGGGAAGCLSAIQMHKNHPDLNIVIIEREKEKMSRGVAYAVHFIHQPLNVRVKGMSADPDDPQHFENWLTENQTRYPYFEFDRNSFVARSIYGDYLAEYFNEVQKKSNGRIEVKECEVDRIHHSGNNFQLITSIGGFQTDFLILATGNFLPKDLPVSTDYLPTDSYFKNPWSDDLFERINPTKDVFIVGSGLSAVDIILGLRAKNHFGKVHLLSRNGYLPLPHKEPVKHVFSNPSALLSGDVYRVFSAIRNEVKSINDGFKDWQDVMDSLRAFTAFAWQKLPDDHKKIFLSRLKPYWEIHRHRIPERSLILIENMKKKNKLMHHKGRLVSVVLQEKMKVQIENENGLSEIQTIYLINCTGPDVDFKNNNSAFYQHALSELDLNTDSFGLGLDCTPDGNLIGKDKRKIKNLFCIGSLRKGILWESTAISDIRMQAKEIANSIDK